MVRIQERREQFEQSLRVSVPRETTVCEAALNYGSNTMVVSSNEELQMPKNDVVIYKTSKYTSFALATIASVSLIAAIAAIFFSPVACAVLFITAVVSGALASIIHMATNMLRDRLPSSLV